MVDEASNLRVAALAEIIAGRLPGTRVTSVPGAGRDARSYRVSGARRAPVLGPLAGAGWPSVALERSVDELAAALQRLLLAPFVEEGWLVRFVELKGSLEPDVLQKRYDAMLAGDEAGGGDLGAPLEFRSGLDLGVRPSDELELTAGIYHLSNGGLYSLNGGAESALFGVTFGL